MKPPSAAGTDLEARALGHLARREHSRAELERKLAPHATPEAIAALLDGLEGSGALSAERLVEQVVHARKGRFGSRRIAYELREKGVAEDLIAAALPEVRAAEQAHAQEAWRRKFGTVPADAREFGRQMRFLVGRGFTADTARQVLRQAGEACASMEGTP